MQGEEEQREAGTASQNFCETHTRGTLTILQLPFMNMLRFNPVILHLDMTLSCKVCTVDGERSMAFPSLIPPLANGSPCSPCSYTPDRCFTPIVFLFVALVLLPRQGDPPLLRQSTLSRRWRCVAESNIGTSNETFCQKEGAYDFHNASNVAYRNRILTHHLPLRRYSPTHSSAFSQGRLRKGARLVHRGRWTRELATSTGVMRGRRLVH